MPQHQHYPANKQRYQQPLLLSGANCNTALRSCQITQSIQRIFDSATNYLPAALYQSVLCQPYQSRQFQRVYQHAKEKKVYQVDNKAQKELEDDLVDSKTYYTDERYDKV